MKKIYMIACSLFALHSLFVVSCKDNPEPIPPDLSITPHTVASLTGRWIMDSAVTLTVYKDNSRPIESATESPIEGFYNFTANQKGDYKWAPDYGEVTSWVLSKDGLTITIQLINKAEDKNESYIYKVMQNKSYQNIWQIDGLYYINGAGKEVKNIKKVYLKKFV
jgi:hypothetical protein